MQNNVEVVKLLLQDSRIDIVAEDVNDVSLYHPKKEETYVPIL